MLASSSPSKARKVAEQLDELAIDSDRITSLEEDCDEYKSYFGNLGKFRFNQQTALISNRTRIIGQSSLEGVLASNKEMNSFRQKKKEDAKPQSPSKVPFLPLIANLGYRKPPTRSPTPTFASVSMSRRMINSRSDHSPESKEQKDQFVRSAPVARTPSPQRTKSPNVARSRTPSPHSGISPRGTSKSSRSKKKKYKSDPNEWAHHSDSDDEIADAAFIGDSKSAESLNRLIMSPRSRFISGCLKEHINPRAAIIVRGNFTTTLMLAHMCIGDKLAVLLADSLRELPHIQAVDISDNNLTDVGLAPLLLALVQIPGLLQLNASQNEIGPDAAAALAEYISKRRCPLEKLVLDIADVDDFECERFISALESNSTLTFLSLCHNKIGTAETLNTVYPDLTTGGEALAAYLRSPLCYLRTLNLAWNCIRLDSAVDLCSAMSVNKNLTYLDLSYNGLGTEGGEALGDAILENKSLRTLLLANNGLKSRATFVLCVSVIENFALTRMSLDGNPIGKQGAKALMNIPMNAGTRVNVSSLGCNFDLEDGSCPFNYASPCKSYKLNLADTFDRAVAFAVLQMGACHQTYMIASASLNGAPIELEQRLSLDRSKYFTEEQLETISNLQRIKTAAENKAMVAQLYAEADPEDTGNISPATFAKILIKLGLSMDEASTNDIIKEVDKDNSGEISLDEIMFFLIQHFDAVSAKLADLTEFPVMVLKSQPANDYVRYVPPKEGLLCLDLVDGIVKKAICKTLSAFDKNSISKVAKESGNTAQMLTNALVTTKVRLTEALELYETMYRDTGKKIKSLSNLLPLMNDFVDARELISRVTKNDKTQLFQLKQEMGAALRPICGFPDGYYALDLSVETSRLCLTRLLEISQTQSHLVASRSPLGYKRFGDTSQHGNWTCFRNELFNEEPVELSTSTFEVIPKKGRLEFDFMSCHRDTMKERPISDGRFMKTLAICGLMTPADMKAELEAMTREKRACDACLNGDGRIIYRMNKMMAAELGLLREAFYDRIEERFAEVDAAIKAEVIRVVTVEPTSTQSAAVTPSRNTRGGKSTPKNGKGGRSTPKAKPKDQPLAVEIPSTPTAGAEVLTGLASPNPSNKDREMSAASVAAVAALNGGSRVGPDGVERGMTPDSIGALLDEAERDFMTARMANPADVNPLLESSFNSANETPQIKQMIKELGNIMNSSSIPQCAKAARANEFLEDSLGREWILARQLWVLVKRYTLGNINRTSFGTYRVEIIIQLFSRVVDIHNFEIVLRELTVPEICCLQCRIGMLKLFNPMRPDGAVELNLGRFEERRLAKIYIGLALVEPGENWQDQAFQHDRETPSMPGWILNDTWKTDAGVVNEGILTLTYFSGDGKKMDDCAPHVPFRKALTYLVCMNEEEYISEAKKLELVLNNGDADSKGPNSRSQTPATPSNTTRMPGKPVGFQYLTANSGLFTTFICPT